ncbi:MAG: glutathione S-transferase [Rickettsiales bacterium]|jgi:glutathione S-transferase
MSNITLYYAKGTCSVAPHAIINHLNITDIKLVSVDLRSHITQDGEDFYKINPKGNVPTLIINENFHLVEGVAIMQYLADNYGGENLIGKIREDKRYKILDVLNFLTSDFHKALALFFNPNINDDFVKNIAIPNFKNKLDYVENSLKENDFLVTNELSLADFYLFSLVGIAKRFLGRKLKTLGIEIENYANISNHYKELLKLEAVQKTLKVEGLAE